MNKEQVRKTILETRIVPVVRAASAQLAMAAAEAVAAGGIPIVELTMTVPGAIDLIAALSHSMGSKVLIGAGTVLDRETAQRCLDAGAQFLVSPGFDSETVRLANSTDTLIMAGALTPTEVITAWKTGADFVKIFPCGNVGGAAYIKALKAALPQIPMVPTGGVNLDTAAAFLAAGASALGVGGELIRAVALEAGDFASISALAKQYVEIVTEA
ncbi:MAG TPA: bifunctional 4-hydroxy-2-oxoglutarate aldolase/2-dehydro-3-deoxy-phosphogluconate aldolase [Bryobacteraceae bacterium]|jgi:2-dehydro-3-deoxyphosphogluconate aldolase/(4S)-4-hydroxy-2-oxoglutarate aldolase|nr:bifunctional 4-hydroxy-2-oxoglutarate aldolase/2-dehydro-3-deoxy-phosphogluconate aldolase [Bryobacteraceae bacterium]